MKVIRPKLPSPMPPHPQLPARSLPGLPGQAHGRCCPLDMAYRSSLRPGVSRHRRALWTLLVLMCCSQLTSSFTICVVHDPPFTICPSATYQGFVQDVKSIRGYDVELLRWVLKDQGYTWDPEAGYADPKYKKYAWRCGPELIWHQVEITSYMGNISSGPWPPLALPPPPPAPPPPGLPPAAGAGGLGGIGNTAPPYPFPCDIGLGDFTIGSSNVAEGTMYVPYFPTGASILTLSSGSVQDPWAFIKPFDWTLWLGFVSFSILVPAAVYFTERLSVEGTLSMNRQGLTDWRMAQYKTILAIFNLQSYPAMSLAARINIITFCFMILIVIQTYNAQLGALFTNSEQSSTINSIADLNGKVVGTYDVYAQILQQDFPDITFVPFSADNTNQMFSQALEALDTGKVHAFMFDVASFMYRLAALPDHCKYRMITENLAYKFTYGFIFNSQWNRTTVMDEFYLSLWRAKEQFIDTDLESKYVGTLPSCAGLASANGVTFLQMSGLFLLVGCITGFMLLCGLGTMFFRVYQSMGQEEEDNALSVSNKGGVKSMSRGQLMASAMSKVFVRQPSAGGSKHGAGAGAGSGRSMSMSNGGGSHGKHAPQGPGLMMARQPSRRVQLPQGEEGQGWRAPSMSPLSSAASAGIAGAAGSALAFKSGSQVIPARAVAQVAQDAAVAKASFNGSAPPPDTQELELPGAGVNMINNSVFAHAPASSDLVTRMTPTGLEEPRQQQAVPAAAPAEMLFEEVQEVLDSLLEEADSDLTVNVDPVAVPRKM